MKYTLLLFLVLPLSSYSQLNCNAYKLENNQSCYEACMMATEAAGGQGLKSSQQQFDKAIELCPQMDYAFMEK